jgi:hypothetical protein
MFARFILYIQFNSFVYWFASYLLYIQVFLVSSSTKILSLKKQKKNNHFPFYHQDIIPRGYKYCFS